MEKITATATGTSVHGNHNNIHMANIHKEQTYEAGASDRYPDIIKILIQSKIPGIEDFFITVNKNSSMEDAKYAMEIMYWILQTKLQNSFLTALHYQFKLHLFNLHFRTTHKFKYRLFENDQQIFPKTFTQLTKQNKENFPIHLFHQPLLAQIPKNPFICMYYIYHYQILTAHRVIY